MQIIVSVTARKVQFIEGFFFCACRVDGMGVYNTVSVNGVWMRLINLLYDQDRHEALIAT
jgi:hypothetical protein